jgi:peptidoglycan/LPS O-acetylase OafA/YrhL
MHSEARAIEHVSQASPDPRDPGASHIAALDGLRGVAAFAVLAHHIDFMSKQAVLFGHAYLAVDFFFVLSGFVMGLAYERRMSEGLTFFSFMRLRLARLYPMVLLGAVMGCTVAVFQKRDFAPGLALAAQLAFVPFFVSRDDAYPLNSVQWSLFFEIFVNGLHAASYKFLSTKSLFVAALAGGIALILTNLHFGGLSVGYSWTNFIGGFPRVIFSYSIGLLTYRLYIKNRLIKIYVPYIIILLMLLIFLAVPKISFIPDFVFVIIIFPSMMILALGSRMPSNLIRLTRWAGTISFPLYAIHVPLLYAAEMLMKIHKINKLSVISWIITAAVVVALSSLLGYMYDAPIHRWLTRRGRGWRPRGDAYASHQP